MRAGVLLTMVCVLLGATAAAASYERPATTEHVSATHHGAAPNHMSYFFDASPDGRYVAFDSYATNLIPDDAREGEYQHVYVRDTLTGRTLRASQSSEGVPGDSMSSDPSISGDGRIVAFSGWAGGLVPGDRGGVSDVFVHDLVTRTTTRLSQTADGTGGDGYSTDAAVSGDGRYVVYSTEAKNLVAPDTNVGTDVLLHDRVTGLNRRVSETAGGTQANGSCLFPEISGDGRTVAYTCGATNLDARDTNAVLDVYVKDLESGAVELISVGGTQASSRPSLSHDGRFVAFMSFAPGLVPDDDNSIPDVFVHDRLLDTTRRVSVDSAGDASESGGHQYAPGNYFPTISPDGRFVAFQSEATDLVPGDTNGSFDVHLHDLATGATTRPIRDRDGGETDKGTGLPVLGADAATIAFLGSSADLVSTPIYPYGDVFASRRGPSLGAYGVTVEKVAGAVQAEGAAGFAGGTGSRAPDPRGDAGTLGTAAGADLIGASVTLRPELDDLLVRLELDALPGVQTGRANAIGVPTVEYGVDFVAGGTPYKVRAGAPGVFTLQRCAATCQPAGTLQGAVGSTAVEATIAVPLDAIGRPSSLTGVVGIATAGGQRLDDVRLGDAVLDPPSVSLALAKPGTAASGWVPATLAGGRFSGQVPTTGRFGTQDLWVRTCSGGACAASATPLSLDRAPTRLSLVVEGRGAKRVLRVLLTGADGVPLAGREVALTMDGNPLATVVTDAAGGATHQLSAGGRHQFGAAYAGDDETAPATASAA